MQVTSPARRRSTCTCPRPARWLEAIHRYGGTLSGGPDFAFRLCTESVRDSLPQFTEQVRDGKIAASTAARQLLQAFQGQTGL